MEMTKMDMSLEGKHKKYLLLVAIGTFPGENAAIAVPLTAKTDAMTLNVCIFEIGCFKRDWIDTERTCFGSKSQEEVLGRREIRESLAFQFVDLQRKSARV